jgi:hypothetical protein
VRIGGVDETISTSSRRKFVLRFSGGTDGFGPAGPSFEAFGLRSGMSAEEVSQKFPTYELRWFASTKGAAMLVNRPVNPENPDLFASLAFCQNQLCQLFGTSTPTMNFSDTCRITSAHPRVWTAGDKGT